jgi:recombinational DNA repair protein RecR
MSWRVEIKGYIKNLQETPIDFYTPKFMISLYENKLNEYEAKITELEKQIELMKCCDNCKVHSKKICQACENGSKWEMRV